MYGWPHFNSGEVVGELIINESDYRTLTKEIEEIKKEISDYQVEEFLDELRKRGYNAEYQVGNQGYPDDHPEGVYF